MTKEEFMGPMNKLVETFGNQQFPLSRMALIYDEVKDLRVEWWSGVVRRMILDFNPKLNFSEAARAERNAFNSAQRTESMIRQSDDVLSKCTEEGFAKIMQQPGGKSPTEILNKRIDKGA